MRDQVQINRRGWSIQSPSIGPLLRKLYEKSALESSNLEILHESKLYIYFALFISFAVIANKVEISFR